MGGTDIAAVAAAIDQQAEQYLQAPVTTLTNVAKTLQNPALPPVDTATGQAHFIAPNNDSFLLNGSAHTIADLIESGVTTSGLSTIGLEYVAVGSPEIDTVADVAMSLHATSDPRILQAKVEQVRIKRNSTSGEVTIELTPYTQVHVYVRDNRGTAVNTTLSGLTYNPLSTSANAITVNYATLVDKIAGKTSAFPANEFRNLQGTFDVKFTVSTNVNVRYTNGDRLPMVDVGIFNTTKGVNGPGIAGKLTVN